jgi:RimJ/RimL family protein N-acetyltransferase
MEIRKGSIEDVPAWFELVYAVKSENLPTLFEMTTPITLESSYRYMEKILSVDGSFVLICFDGSKAVGSLDCLRKERKEESHVASIGMCVAKASRGQGIGRRLLLSLFDICKQEKKIEKIELDVFSNNPGAIALYKSLGFELEGVKKGSIRKGGEAIDLICMGKFLY